MVTLYTVGHSDRPLDQFLALLSGAGVRRLVDVRSFPASRHCPQFGQGPLAQALFAAGIEYLWLGRELGGLRKARRDSPHVALRNASFRGYADHMESDAFRAGIEQLLALAADAPTAIMCAERRPEQCHRSMIADHLALAGHSVIHLIDARERRPHRPKPEARRHAGGVIYDRRQGELL